ncbi:MAG: bifunctional folylpolyglutamate synthase/dihydrofolate synthase [Nitrospirae bacterium]|nr:MAG: bifunctional folylpolyglutamate synthase/dihydrofolate synthase [Nitrospirota bacterium]
MNYEESISYLYNLTHHGIKLGLENPKRLLKLAGNPERSFRSIHIAGTNGKGSTAVILSELLRGAGVKTGLFTSPHLLRFTERIRVDGREISKDEVSKILQDLLAILKTTQDLKPTFFEMVTAIGFEHFRRNSVQWAVVETGMGGRFDATNVIEPEVSIITPVGYDHREFLGNTLKEIAFEKAGILKERVPLILAPQEDEAEEVILKRAYDLSVPVRRYGHDFGAIPVDYNDTGITMTFWRRQPEGDGNPEIQEFTDLPLPLQGEHQIINASLALEAFFKILPEMGRDVELIRKSLSGVVWPGRLDFREFNGHTILLDGAHNPPATKSLARYLKKLLSLNKYREITLIFGAMKDKNISETLSPLLPLADRVILTSMKYERAATSSDLLKTLRENGNPGDQSAHPVFEVAESVRDAIRIATGVPEKDKLTVITGSLYLVGDALEILGERPLLRRLSEAR